jgi:hypothetical protein
MKSGMYITVGRDPTLKVKVSRLSFASIAPSKPTIPNSHICQAKNKMSIGINSNNKSKKFFFSFFFFFFFFFLN